MPVVLFLIIFILDLLVYRRHYVSDLKPNSTHFDEVTFHKANHGWFHFGYITFFYNTPNFFFRLLLEYFLKLFIYEVFVEEPVLAFFEKDASDDAVSVLRADGSFIINKSMHGIIINLVNCDFTFVSKNTLCTLDFELFELHVFTFEVIKAMWLTGPGRSSHMYLRAVFYLLRSVFKSPRTCLLARLDLVKFSYYNLWIFCSLRSTHAC